MRRRDNLEALIGLECTILSRGFSHRAMTDYYVKSSIERCFNDASSRMGDGTPRECTPNDTKLGLTDQPISG